MWRVGLVASVIPTQGRVSWLCPAETTPWRSRAAYSATSSRWPSHSHTCCESNIINTISCQTHLQRLGVGCQCQIPGEWRRVAVTLPLPLTPLPYPRNCSSQSHYTAESASGASAPLCNTTLHSHVSHYCRWSATSGQNVSVRSSIDSLRTAFHKTGGLGSDLLPIVFCVVF